MQEDLTLTLTLPLTLPLTLTLTLTTFRPQGTKKRAPTRKPRAMNAKL